MRPATVARWIAVLWAARDRPALRRVRAIRRRFLPRQAHQSLCVVDGRRRLRPVCAAARQAHRPPHPGRADDRSCRTWSAPKASAPPTTSLRRRRAGRHRDRRALAQYRHRAAVPAPGIQFDARKIPLARLAAAGDRDCSSSRPQGTAHARRPEEARSDRQLHRRAMRRPRSIRACSTRSTARRSGRSRAIPGSPEVADRVRARRGRGLCVGRHQRRDAGADDALDQGRQRQGVDADGHEARRQLPRRADGDRGR